MQLLRTRVTPAAIPTAVAMLVVLALIAIIGVLTRPSDAVVIEVVPIDDDQLQVQVAGAVAETGVFALPPGSTVADALQLAGGTVDGADTGSLDLALELSDGQFIVVPGGSDPEDVASSGPIDINAATVSELEMLPGVGPVIAGRIVQYRETLGGFTSVDQLVEISGISERMVAELRPLVVVETP